MRTILNITNGDCAVQIMEKAGIPGFFLPWRDVLHDGPVPAHLSLEQLSEIRSQFIIDQGWGEPEKIKHAFIERDNTIKSFEKYEKIILWFEHDLYDQLQMLQILDWFYKNGKKAKSLSMICVDQYLGMLSPDEMLALYKYEEPVTDSQLALSSKAWSAFRSDSPESWLALLKTDTTALPFLAGAIIRMLEEYPGCANGLSRTAQNTLEIIQQGEKQPGRVFDRCQETEERKFLGDSGFWSLLQAFLASSPPLLTLPEDMALTLPANPDQELTLTQAGKDVLSGKKNWLDIIELDRWIGGVHLSFDNILCWDSGSSTLIKRDQH
jgi:hypothetical protein